MKTTVDLPENLLTELRAAAERRGWTVRVVFEESLRAFLQRDEASARNQPFRLAHTVVQGREFPGMSFTQMLEATDPNRLPANKIPANSIEAGSIEAGSVEAGSIEAGSVEK